MKLTLVIFGSLIQFHAPVAVQTVVIIRMTKMLGTAQVHKGNRWEVVFQLYRAFCGFHELTRQPMIGSRNSQCQIKSTKTVVMRLDVLGFSLQIAAARKANLTM